MLEITSNPALNHRFLEGFSQKQVEFVLAQSKIMDFAPNQYIANVGEPAKEFYLILNGKVVLRSVEPDSHYTTIEILGKDEVLGWSWLIPPHKWHFSAEAVQPTATLAINGARLRDRCNEDPLFGYHLYKEIASLVGNRLRATRMRLR